MIGHDRALELAATSIDFGLSPADDAALTDHLGDCASCRETAAALRADAAALRALDQVDAPDPLRERILASIATAPEMPDARSVPDSNRKRTRAPLLHFPTRMPRPALLAAAAVMVLAVIGGTLWWRSGPPSGGVAVVHPSDRPGSSSSGGVAGPSGAPSSAPSTDVVTSDPQLASLSARDETDGVVPIDTTFELAALGGRSAADLAEHLKVQPEIEMTTTVEPDGRVRLTPKEPLSPGVVYRFRLTAPDGSATDSWAFQARSPIQVVSTLPGPDETDVPVDTGIEVTFDQDGVTGAQEHFSIEPKVEGRFEQHGRVLSFIPDRLRPATIYTVTITQGVTVESTGVALERDVRFSFETAATSEPSSPSNFLRFSNDLFESATAERPVVGLWWFADDPDDQSSKTPRTTHLDVFRFADRAAAIAAFQALREVPRWSRWNATENVPSTGLTKVAGIEATLRDANGTLWTTLPERLQAGWYLIEHPDARTPAQAVLQVTDVSAYLAVSDRRSVIWANDLATRQPIAAAAVESGGGALGRTDPNGLLLVDTPQGWSSSVLNACTEDCTPIVTVATGGRSAFLPVTGRSNPDGKGSLYDEFDGAADARYWILFDTDRVSYRRTDTINVWGMVRARDTGAVPTTVELRLDLDDGGAAPITLAHAKTRPTGAFTGSLPLRDVPEGTYTLELRLDGEAVTRRSITVERLLKPAYRLDVVTGRRVYVVGDRIRVDSTARFFEGTPVPGVPIRLDGDVRGRATTDATGATTIRGVARWYDTEDAGREGPRSASVTASPARAEEGDGQFTEREFVIFPSHWLVRGEASLEGRRLRITGSANELDRNRVEREVSGGTSAWEVDPRGKGLTGRTVRARIIEEVPIRTRTGTSYDFVEKRVIPLYTYDQRDRVLTTLRLRTTAGGRFSTAVRVPDIRHSYRVELTITDPDGLRSTATLYASAEDDTFDVDRAPELLATADPRGQEGFATVVGIGERVDLTMHEPDATGPVGRQPHLYFAAQGGIREATVRASNRYVTRFPDWGAPNVSYRAVRFTGRGYVESGSHGVTFRAADRALTVSVAPDRTRYAPGQTARLSITTRGADGRPTSATVVLRAVDEKLFFLGAAADSDPLARLYEHVPSGVAATYATHRGPSDRSGGADTGGGGADGSRNNDTILFRAIDTDTGGKATVDLPLPSDLTSWHVSAAAIGGNVTAGGAMTLVPVALPFFVDTSIAPQYLVGDRPSIQVRGFGSALAADSRVTFTVDSEDLGLHERALTARAFQAVTVALPRLTVGRHKITITGQSGKGSALMRHVVTRSFDVVPSRLTRTRSTYAEPTGSTSIGGEGDISELIVTDAGRGRLLPVIYGLAGSESGRVEAALGADVAAGLLAERFDDDAFADSNAFRGSTYQREDGGISPLPYAGSDLEVSVLAALAAPERFNGASLRYYLRTIAERASETRERRNLALAGLAGTGEPMLPGIRAALRQPDLTIRERLMLAIGAARLGDTTIARQVAVDIAAAYGERHGDSARLRVGTDTLDDTTASALMAMLLAAYGDRVAPSYWAYVASNGLDSAALALHATAYARWMIDKLPATRARFAYNVDGTRTEVDLAPGDTFRILVPRAQRAGFSVEPIDGRLGVTTTWQEPIDAAAIPGASDITMSRSITPRGVIDDSALVAVDLRVTFGPHAPNGCHRVVDLVPSGLVPISALRGYIDPETGEEVASSVVSPDSQSGQRVVFCAEPTPRSRTTTLRYLARVISIGTYRWEPAIAASRTQAGDAAVVPEMVVRIR